MRSLIVLFVVFASYLPHALWAETMVALDNSGAVKSGAAIAWSEEGLETVVFTLKEAYSSEKIAAELKDKLSRVEVEAIGIKYIKISGLPANELYARLSFIELKSTSDASTIDINALSYNPQSDPLAKLDGSSSIRASEMQIAPLDMGSSEKSFDGVVVEVRRENDFPFATLIVRIIRLPELKEKPHTLLKTGESYLLHPFVLLKKNSEGVKTPDWSNRESMANAGVWHMKPGDIVTGEIISENSDGFNARYVIVKK